MNTARITTIVPVAALATLIAGPLMIGLDAPVRADENPPLAALGPPPVPPDNPMTPAKIELEATAVIPE